MNPIQAVQQFLGMLKFKSGKIRMYRTLLDMVQNRADAAPVQFVQVFRRWTARDKARGELRWHIYDQIARRWELGGHVSLARALAPFITAQEVMILETAEIGGDKATATALSTTITYLQAQAKLKAAVKGALWLPIGGVITLYLTAWGMGGYMMKDLMKTLKPELWPGWALPATQGMIWIYDHTLLVLLPIALLVGLYHFSVDKWTGRARSLVDAVPPWAAYRVVAGASLLSVLSPLLAAGLTLREALERARNTSTGYLRWQIARMVGVLERSGERQFNAMRTGFFTTDIIDQIEDASANTEFVKALAHVGRESLDQVIEDTQNQIQQIAAIVELAVGAGFMYIMAAILLGTLTAADRVH